MWGQEEQIKVHSDKTTNTNIKLCLLILEQNKEQRSSSSLMGGGGGRCQRGVASMIECSWWGRGGGVCMSLGCLHVRYEVWQVWWWSCCAWVGCVQCMDSKCAWCDRCIGGVPGAHMRKVWRCLTCDHGVRGV